ncbi:metallophosphoesterase [Bacillus mexicanus]|uniref:metallophosphoesterase n=1 Tax=Bacillus mexicanus TaxID=2834415 RepID=UPI003D1FC7C1
MRIAILNDLHLDLNSIEMKYNLVPELIEGLKSKNPDLIIIAGDIANYASDSVRVIDKIQEKLAKQVLFIPGNHDIWTSKEVAIKGIDSWENYNFFSKHSSSLIDKPYHINDEYVVIGDMGWYDYSFAPETIPIYTMKSRKKSLWSDGKYAIWNMDDQKLMKRMLDKFQKMFEEHKNKKVIFVNHFVPYKEFITYSHNNNQWNLTNGFLGSENLGWLIDQYPNIKYVIFGHTHKRYGKVNRKNKTVICNPLGYVGEWTTNNFLKELEKAITIIEV